MQALERNVKRSFLAVKRDYDRVREAFLNQQENIKKLDRNQKVLLEKIAKLEKQLEKEKEQYVGANTTQKVHDPKCVYAKNIKTENRVYFPTVEIAAKQGYNVCTCLK